MPGSLYTTREEWLLAAARLLTDVFSDEFGEIFGEEGAEHLSLVSVSCGFPSTRGASGKVIGECWPASTTADGTHHVFISPLLDDPVVVLSTLLHELVHAADNGKSSHKGKFTKCIRALGLVGKPTATLAGEELTVTLKDALGALGPFPHSVLKPGARLTPPQKTRMLKVVCPECGCTLRITQKWIDTAGLPLCGTRHDDGDSWVNVRMEQAE